MWEVQDAWLLQAVVYAGPRGRLSRVIAQADFINHAVPTPAELATSIGRLEAAGLVRADAARVRATRSGRRLVRNSERWRGDIQSATPRVEAALSQDVPFPLESAPWALPEEYVRQAYEGHARG